MIRCFFGDMNAKSIRYRMSRSNEKSWMDVDRGSIDSVYQVVMGVFSGLSRCKTCSRRFIIIALITLTYVELITEKSSTITYGVPFFCWTISQKDCEMSHPLHTSKTKYHEKYAYITSYLILIQCSTIYLILFGNFSVQSHISFFFSG